MNSEYLKLQKAAEYIKSVVDFKPKVALVLGSGLGGFADGIEVVSSIPYSDIPDFPVSTVPGHKGRFVLGYVGEVPVVIMQGRIHYYESRKMTETVMPIRVMRLLGAQILFLTCAAGGINPAFSAGDMMMICDHITSFVPSPLVGENIDELGKRFSDMSEVYNKELQNILTKTAVEEGITLEKGVYIQLSGPNYETPAEIRMCKTLGADAVGMSTACEAMTAVHMGMKVMGVSVISNLAAGISKNPLTHEEVQEAADRTAPVFKRLIYKTIEKLM